MSNLAQRPEFKAKYDNYIGGKFVAPIGGQYLLGDIGPGGGRIFVTPDSKNTQLFSDNLVKAQTPSGYFYEVFYPNWIGFNSYEV